MVCHLEGPEWICWFLSSGGLGSSLPWKLRELWIIISRFLWSLFLLLNSEQLHHRYNISDVLVPASGFLIASLLVTFRILNIQKWQITIFNIPVVVSIPQVNSFNIQIVVCLETKKYLQKRLDLNKALDRSNPLAHLLCSFRKLYYQPES